MVFFSTAWNILLAAVLIAKCSAFRFDNSEEDAKESLPQTGHLELDMREKVRQGEKSYEMLKSEAPLYGACWLNAMDALHVGCKHLDEDVHARLGLLFANCFLEKIGDKTFPCPPTQPVVACTAHMDERGFQAYTQFFIHTQSICFFLANQVWQSRAEHTIGRMTSASHQVAERLQRLQSLQQKSIDTQMQLNQELGASKTALKDFEQTLRDKQSMEQEILIRFLEMRDFILNEVSKFYAIGFYCGSIMFFYMLTTPVRTKEARLWTFLVLAFNLLLERLIVSNILSDEASLVRELWIISNNIDDHIWMSRKAGLIIAFIVLLYFASTYKDYTLLNNVLLNDIRKQNEEIKRLHEISLTQKSDMAEISTMMQSFMSADESSTNSEEEVSDGEVCALVKESSPPELYTAVAQTLAVEPQMKAIVAVESGSRRYDLRARSPPTYAVRSLTGRRTGSYRKLATSDSFTKNIFSSDEDC